MISLRSKAAFLLLMLVASMHQRLRCDAIQAGQCNAELEQCESHFEVDTEQAEGLQQLQSSSITSADQHSGVAVQIVDALTDNRFPSNNTVLRMTGKQLQELLGSSAANSSSNSSSVVVLFYLENCPHSVALRPVFECIPAFFPENVIFARVPYSDMSLMLLMTHGLHALPVLQVNRQGRKYRYNGKHWLGPMVAFIAKALGQEPLASLDIAQLCTPTEQQQLLLQLQQLHERQQQSSTPPSGTPTDASSSSTVDEGVGSSSITEMYLQQQQRMVCGNWSCPRWDGEATVEELSEQQHATLFWISVAFLVCRAVWWTLRRVNKSRQSRAEAAAAAAPTAAAAAPAGADAQQQQPQQQQPPSSSRDGAGTSQVEEAHLHRD